jgi:thioredoxin reductase
MCEGQDVVIVGGGNSAGQAAVFVSRFAAHVYILVRADSLADSMSRYLIRRIEETPNITLHTRTEVVELKGDWTSQAENNRPNCLIIKVLALKLGSNRFGPVIFSNTEVTRAVAWPSVKFP